MYVVRDTATGYYQVHDLDNVKMICWTDKENYAKWICQALNFFEETAFIFPKKEK